MMFIKPELLCIPLFLLKFTLIEAYLIGERCKYDEDCFVDHSFCEMQQICECKENFIVSEDGETCIALVGAYCHSKYDCATLPNSLCKEDKCVCDQGFVPDSQQTKCIPMAQQIKDNCESDVQCRAKLGMESLCYNRQCQCLPGYHYDSQCIKSKRLREDCRNNSQCYIGDNLRDTIVCSNGFCRCAPGHYEIFDACVENGSPGVASGFFFFVVMTISVKFCL